MAKPLIFKEDIYRDMGIIDKKNGKERPALVAKGNEQLAISI